MLRQTTIKKWGNTVNIKRVAIGSIVGTIVLYLLGMLIWQILFADFFAANQGSATGVDREAPILWAVVLGTACYAVLLNLGLESAGSSGSIANSLKVGAVIGALTWGTADFILYGFFNLNTVTAAVADTLLEGVRGAVSAAIIAAVLAKVGD